MNTPDELRSLALTSRVMGLAVKNYDSTNKVGIFIGNILIARVDPGSLFVLSGVDIRFAFLGFSGVTGVGGVTGVAISDCDIRAYCMAGDK